MGEPNHPQAMDMRRGNSYQDSLSNPCERREDGVGVAKRYATPILFLGLTGPLSGCGLTRLGGCTPLRLWRRDNNDDYCLDNDNAVVIV